MYDSFIAQPTTSARSGHVTTHPAFPPVTSTVRPVRSNAGASNLTVKCSRRNCPCDRSIPFSVMAVDRCGWCGVVRVRCRPLIAASSYTHPELQARPSANGSAVDASVDALDDISRRETHASCTTLDTCECLDANEVLTVGWRLENNDAGRAVLRCP